MSHFSVAVFTDENSSVETLLEPFYEGLEVEKYIALTKEDVIKRGKELISHLQKIYKEYRKDKTAYRRKYSKNIAHLRFIKRIPIIAKWKNDRIYKEEIKYYEPEEISEDGGIYSTYNPKSRWDWYEVGGRWKNMLIINNPYNPESTIKANARFFASMDEVPKQAYTMGIKSIMSAKKILLIATGEAKADALYKSLYGPITPNVPASILQLHPDVTVVADEAALKLIREKGLL